MKTTDNSDAKVVGGDDANVGIGNDKKAGVSNDPSIDKVVKTDAEWRKLLTPEQFRIMRGKGTEPSFSGKYDIFFENGEYHCAACGALLFKSDSKFNSGCGWPAFSAAADDKMITRTVDHSFGMERVEVTCTRCGAHLGHVFDDGPGPTHVRYCINSASLDFAAAEKKNAASQPTKTDMPASQPVEK